MTARSRQHSGLLLVVATPIGNLGDISERALEALHSSDLIAAEDTRRIAKLLMHFGIQKPLESFHGDSTEGKLVRLIERLQAGQTIAYVSDAGTPTIADPGAALVRRAAEVNVTISPIPGPSAVTAALSASGLNADRFVFLGYPPRKASERVEFATQAVSQPWTVVLCEAPSRVAATVADLAKAAPDRYAVIARELTKRFEQFLRGSLTQLAEQLATDQPRGEFVIMLQAAPTTAEIEHDEAAMRAGIEKLLQAGASVRGAADIVSTLTGLPRNSAYDLALQISRKQSK